MKCDVDAQLHMKYTWNGKSPRRIVYVILVEASLSVHIEIAFSIVTLCTASGQEV
jgi:hypothetical protein